MVHNCYHWCGVVCIVAPPKHSASNTNIYLNLAQSFALNDYWPKNDKSCGNYGGCPFQVICSRDPKVRSEFIKHEGFYKRHWNPLENR